MTNHEQTAGDESIACQICSAPNPVWFAPSADWNLVMGGPEARDDPGGIVCPSCYMWRAEAAGLKPTAWVVSREGLGPEGGDRTTSRDGVTATSVRAAPSLPAGAADPVASAIIQELQHIRIGMLDHYQAATILERLVYKARSVESAAPTPPTTAGSAEGVKLDREAGRWLDAIGFAPWLWADPAHDPIGQKPKFAEARIEAPMNISQPFTPSQYALVLRWDLVTILSELVWRRAQVESLRRQRADIASPTPTQTGEGR